MNAHQLPLLCHNTDVYQGPLVPTNGLKGHIHAEGLTEQDELTIIGMTTGMESGALGKLSSSVVAVVFDPKKYVYVKAIRHVSSGKPITVWVA